MFDKQVARNAARNNRSPIRVAIIFVSVTVIGFLGYQSLVASAASPMKIWRGDTDTRLGQEQGAVPDDVTVFDDEVPAVANLDPDLLHALRQAATDAADDGVGFFVNSGWRSPEYQQRLLDEAVEEYGSPAEAAQWVATPDSSAHVSGDAVDIGESDAQEWLAERGFAYGLCPIYDNEPWHFELRPLAAYTGCPATYADPSEDPRLQG